MYHFKHIPKKAIVPRFQLAGIIKQTPGQTCSACKKS
jgi:hypothetical protein